MILEREQAILWAEVKAAVDRSVNRGNEPADVARAVLGYVSAFAMALLAWTPLRTAEHVRAVCDFALQYVAAGKDPPS